MAVNKCDNEERVNQAFEFHEMPLEQPITISAYHGKNIDEVMEKVTANIPSLHPFPLRVRHHDNSHTRPTQCGKVDASE